MQDRAKLRQQCQKLRRVLPAEQQQTHAHLAAKKLGQLALFQDAQHIAFYLASDGEINPAEAIKLALAQKKSCYLPIMHPLKSNEILFMPYQLGDSLISNQYGILEPPLDAARIAFPWNMDLVLTPLVAFDDYGNRLGHGAGCYDRAFAFLPHQHPKQTQLLGFAHEFQCVSEIAPAIWDIPLDGILTESKFRSF